MRDKLISKAEAAEMLGVSIDTVERLVRRGDLAMYRIASLVRFSEREIYQFICDNRVQAPVQWPRPSRTKERTDSTIHYIPNQKVV